jgi:hypothetical protein
MPTPPWKHDRPLPPFFAKDEKLSLLIALVMGGQHALAMASPFTASLFSGYSSLALEMPLVLFTVAQENGPGFGRHMLPSTSP